MGQTEAETSPDQRGWGAMHITASPQGRSNIPRGAIFTTVVMKLVSDGLGQFLKLRIGDSRVLSRETEVGGAGRGCCMKALKNVFPKALGCVPTTVSTGSSPRPLQSCPHELNRLTDIG